MDELKERILLRLKHAVQLLASSPDVQLELLPPFVCKADELALEFDHWQDVALHNYSGELTADQLCALKLLNEKFTWLTENAKEEWTDEAVRNSQQWKSVRHLAAKALGAFDWPMESPPSYAHEYVSTDPKLSTT